MASALLSSGTLASTPPQHAPTRGARRASAGGIVAFRSTPSEDAAGSFSRPSSGSLMESGSWQSLARSAGAEAARKAAAAAAPQRPTPKSSAFIKIEGFAAEGFAAGGDAPAASPPASPPCPAGAQRAPSLLSRQLSVDSLTTLHRPTPAPAGLAAHLEARCSPPAAAPSPAPAARRAPSSPPDAQLLGLQARHPVFREPRAVRAFTAGRLAHGAGTEAFSRCAGAAAVLAELGGDEVAVAGALLHDTLDGTMLLEGQLLGMLGSEEVVELTRRASHLGYIAQRFRAASHGGEGGGAAAGARLVDMLVAHGPPRALLVLLAAALHDARRLDACGGAAGGAEAGAAPAAAAARAAARLRAARAALDLWAPLANRLGVWPIKIELEDRAFRALHPAEHAELRDGLERMQRPEALVGLVDTLRSELQAAGVEYLDLSGRPKHLYGVWRKMEAKGYPAGRVQDVRGVRVIVRSRGDCYRALRAVEAAGWRLAAPPKNYIREPKPNGYQSLHVVVDPGDGQPVEIQIRTDKMHYLAEYGADAAHWQYKDGAARGGGAGAEAAWAKFVTSQAVGRDLKCRPSGSPDADHSLSSILSSIDDAASPPDGAEAAAAAGAGAPSGRSFQEYITSTGQRPAPPAERRAMVAVVAGGAFSVAELPAGTTLGGLLESCGEQAAPAPCPRPARPFPHCCPSNAAGAAAHAGECPDRPSCFFSDPAPAAAPTPSLGRAGPHLRSRRLHVVLNRQVESDPGAVLAAGDVVELYAEPAPPAEEAAAPPAAAPGHGLVVVPPPTGPAQRLGRQQGNLLPVGALGRKLRAAALG
jgi:hypothetical protein